MQGFLTITISGGVAVLPADAESPDGLVGSGHGVVPKHAGNQVLLFSEAVNPPGR